MNANLIHSMDAELIRRSAQRAVWGEYVSPIWQFIHNNESNLKTFRATLVELYGPSPMADAKGDQFELQCRAHSAFNLIKERANVCS